MNPLISSQNEIIKLAISSVVVLQVIVVFFIDKIEAFIKTLIQDPTAVRVALNLVGVPSLGFVGIFIIWLYESHLWKIIYPKYDFSGKWYLKDSFYEINPQTGVKETNMITFGWIIIDQNPSKISISQGFSFYPNNKQQVSTWHSIACDLSSDGKHVIAAIELTRRSVVEKGLPNAGRAVDILNVVDNRKNKRSRPNKLSGRTYHCVEEGRRSLIGETDYFRIKPKDYPDYLDYD